MNYRVKRICTINISTFYHNVAKKYKHTYSLEMMRKNIADAYDAMFEIEQTLLRRKPSIKRWENFYMAHSGHWYYAYTISGDIVTIEDACHEQNMHDEE